MSAISVIIAAARRRIVRQFEDAGATSAADAITYGPARRIDERKFERMEARGVLLAARCGHHYPDQGAYAVFMKGQRRTVAGAMGPVAAAGAVRALDTLA